MRTLPREAQRGVPLQALQAATTSRPAAVDPLTAPRVATFGQIPAVVVRSATAPARPQTDVHFVVFCCSKSGPQGVEHGLVMRRGVLPAGAAACRDRSGNQERLFEQCVGQEELAPVRAGFP